MIATIAVGEDGALAVSPGSAEGTVVAQACPSFSWGVVRNAQSYELIAYKVPKGLTHPSDSSALKEIWHTTVPGSARSWTPPASQCFTHGGGYAWAVRAEVGGQMGPWSEANLFTVDKAPTTQEVRQAMATIQRYLSSHGGKLPAPEARASKSRSKAAIASKSKKKAQAPKASSSVDFSVDATGNVTGAAFAGTGFAASGGDVTTDHELISTVASGTAPLSVSSTTLVSNLNSDEVDGYHASASPVAGDILVLNSEGQVPTESLGNVDVAQVPRSNSITTVDTSNTVGQYTSITIGTDGFPVVSYLDATNGYLEVAHCSDGSCSTFDTPTTVDNTGDVGGYTSIAIGTDDFPVISYWDSTNGYLKVAHCTDASCSTFDAPTTVDNSGNVGGYTSIAIGTDGFPVVSYYDQSNRQLQVAHCTDTSCSSFDAPSTVQSGNVGEYTSIAIGADGLPVVSYYDFHNADVNVAHCTDVSCSSVALAVVDPSGGAVGHTSIAIGTDSFPIVSYYASGHLRVAHCTDVSCSTVDNYTIVDNTNGVGQFTSIAIGTDGFPVVSYYDATNGYLKVAHCTDVSCSSATLTTVDSTGGVGQYTSVAIGMDGLPVVSYYDLTDTALKVVKCANRFCLNNWTRR